mmetsp:Transcript_14215/g.38270  ORF Transcript_14215/g.38270 Transcript_14215/m.38270 type:complete len:223 (+) Transcript_14215:216-884(+)
MRLCSAATAARSRPEATSGPLAGETCRSNSRTPRTPCRWARCRAWCTPIVAFTSFCALPEVETCSRSPIAQGSRCERGTERASRGTGSGSPPASLAAASGAEYHVRATTRPTRRHYRAAPGPRARHQHEARPRGASALRGIGTLQTGGRRTAPPRPHGRTPGERRGRGGCERALASARGTRARRLLLDLVMTEEHRSSLLLRPFNRPFRVRSSHDHGVVSCF